MNIRAARLVLSLAIVFGGLVLLPTLPAAAQETDSTASLVLHWRACAEVPANDDWYGTCHDAYPDARAREDGREAAMVNQETNERITAVLDENADATFSLPPGTYFIEGVPGDFVEEAYSFCSTADNPATSIGHPVTVAPGDRVLCDFYFAPSSARGDLDCIDFATQEDAQQKRDQDPLDLDDLDPDGDGIACNERGSPFAGSETPAASETPQSEFDDGIPAAIYEGDCAPGPFVDPVLELEDATIPANRVVGPEPSAYVHTSETTGNVQLDALVAEQQVIAVFDPVAPDALVACGMIGGALNDNGSLTVALVEAQDSGFSGTATIIPAGEAGGSVTVTLVLYRVSTM